MRNDTCPQRGYTLPLAFGRSWPISVQCVVCSLRWDSPGGEELLILVGVFCMEEKIKVLQNK